MNNSKKIFSIVVVVLLIFLIGIAVWAFFSNDNSQNTNTGTVPERNNSTTSDEALTREIIIRFTAEGFVPQTLNVERGDTVVFINETDSGMWVASAPHPAHTDYPEFDQLSSVVAGGVYRFLFEKAGTWRFHNHENPEFGGTVEVK